MKGTLARTVSLLLVLWVIVAASGCQSGRDSINMLLQADSPTLVSFPLMAGSQVYDFSADAQLSTQISLVPITHNLSYTAELLDENGDVMATVSSSAIQDAVLTIAPGSKRYSVAIRSDNTTVQGMLSMQVARSAALSPNVAALKAAVPTPVIVPFQSVAIPTPAVYVPCSVSSSTGVTVNLRSGPGLEYGVVGSLIYGTALSVNGKADNGWYQVIQNGQLTWVSASVTIITGDCAALPDVTPITPVLADGRVSLIIAESGWGSINESVDSYPQTSADLIVISYGSVGSSSQQYHEFTLTLVCSGDGMERLRWGAVEQPSLECGGSIILPLTPAYDQQTIAVTLPLSATYSAVQYTLMATRRV